VCKAAIAFFSDKDSWTRFGVISKVMKIVKKKANDPELPVTFWRHLLAQ
jgi:hypothetical protein